MTNKNPIAKEVAPALIESSPKSGPTVLSSIIFKGAGKDRIFWCLSKLNILNNLHSYGLWNLWRPVCLYRFTRCDKFELPNSFMGSIPGADKNA